MDAASARRAHFDRDGVVIVEWALGRGDLERFDAIFARMRAGGAGARQSRLDPADRDVLARDATLTRLATELTGDSARLVRVIAFDKTPEANWFVPWHQDRAIALAGRHDLAGFGPWTIKDGLVHTEPPVALLDAMVTLRIHLDDCTEDDGPLEVARGSHRLGRLEKTRIADAVESGGMTLCLANRGDIVAMRPLTLHRSQRARRPSCRRVLHLEYCAVSLPAPLMWAIDRVAGVA